jgi:tRNA/tmRNA/rRNA uracil-C5-methylase (TrmA/RlmC/RlmD family)
MDMDIDKQRATYVIELEQKLAYLQEQLAHFKPQAEKWTPVLKGQIEGSACRFTLAFGGKRVTGEVSVQSMAQNSAESVTAALVDTLIESLVADVLRKEVKPEVERIQRGVTSVYRSSL